MPTFERIVPDDQRSKGQPFLSASNENAKTELLEALMNSSLPDGVNGSSGLHGRNTPKPQRNVMFQLYDHENLGGGRYRAKYYELDGIKWTTAKDEDLSAEMLGRVRGEFKSSSLDGECEVWYLPELGTTDHNLDDDPESPTVFRGIGVAAATDHHGRTIVICSSAPSAVAKEVKCVDDYGHASNLVSVKSYISGGMFGELYDVSIIHHTSLNDIFRVIPADTDTGFIQIGYPYQRSQFMVLQIMDTPGGPQSIDWDFVKAHE